MKTDYLGVKYSVAEIFINVAFQEWDEIERKLVGSQQRRLTRRLLWRKMLMGRESRILGSTQLEVG